METLSIYVKLSMWKCSKWHKRNDYEKLRSGNYLIICPELQQNTYESEKYSQYGYEDEREILWMYHLPVSFKQAEKYGNKFQSASDINVMFTGWGASVSIGKNVKFPKNKSLMIPSDSNVQIGDNVNLNDCDITLSRGNELRIGNKCSLGRVRIFLNIDGKLDIGEECTFGGGI